MSLSPAAKKYLGSSAGVGAALAILFGILAGTSSGGNQTAYIGACVVCGLIAVVCIIVLAVKS